MKSRVLRISGHVALILLAMFYGMAVVKFQLFPYQLMIRFIDTGYISQIQNKYRETQREYWETNVEEIISITEPNEVVRLRNEFINILWGQQGLPKSLPEEIFKNFKDARYEDIKSLSKIDKLLVEMDFGIESHVYHFIPKKPYNKVVFYHQGHDGDFYVSKAQIRRFLDDGYSVVAFSMPLLGLNNQPTVYLPRQGNLKLTNHDQMKYLRPKSGHPVKYFIEPVVIALNYLDKNFEYSAVSMVGISGGGWTTTLAAAVDIRIQKSFPVAGSYPIYLRSNSDRSWGDYEQTVPRLYNTINYLELYILGSHGEGRKQLQVINQYDSCCFGGTKSETYNDVIRKRVQKLGEGAFDLLLDDSHNQHQISDLAMKRILDEI